MLAGVGMLDWHEKIFFSKPKIYFKPFVPDDFVIPQNMFWTEAHSEPYQTSTMKLLAKNASILDVWLGSEYTSDKSFY